MYTVHHQRAAQFRMLSLTVVVSALCVATIARGADAPVDFNRDVRPMLTQACFKCHGPDAKERKAGLRLDTRDGATADLKGTHAIVPGNLKESELLRRVTADDDDVMPPTKSGKKLSPAEVSVLRRWIEQGAPYARHWAYVKPVRPEPPSVKDVQWVRNPIDSFVLARLEKQGVHPAPEADRYIWIRRVTLDLTGLPPTIDEVDAFVKDTSADAYEKVVDRLLKAPAYGERWARVWLDLARYADTAGYAQDPERTIWRYRDWLINALNDNKPFDQFTIEQLAGDLLPNPTEDQLIATAFNRNTMTNSEGGTNDEEFRNVAIVDRVNTTMTVWMGLTMECAHCHNHKYDPISQREYYRIFAVLNNTEDADRGDESPNLVTLSSEQMEQRKQLEGQIAEVEKAIAAKLAQAAADNTKPQSALPTGPLEARFVRVELLGKGVFLHLAEVQAFTGNDNIAAKGKATQSSTDYGGSPERAIDGNTDGIYTNNSVSHTAASDNPWWEVDLGQSQVLDRVVLWNRTDGNVGGRLKPFRVVVLDDKRQPIFVRQFDQSPEKDLAIALPKSADQLDDKTRLAITQYVTGAAPQLPEQKHLENLKKQLAAIKGVPTPIMRELPEKQRRTTHIQIRGNYQALGDEVTPGLLEQIGPPVAPAQGEVNRLTLAKWLVSDDNPLTARVTVNRYWEQLFGDGIVRTSEDFGVQGEPPTHPLLLDWLATELVRLKWDTKALVKLIVLSATYRQSSRVTPELLALDPDNRLLARGPRFRLSAETIRDQALAVSGLISRKMYGPSVKPPQPKLGLRSAFGGSTDWDPSPGEDRYRRGLYTFWRRTTPYPSMLTFDATSREVCTIRRVRTNTPLQALVTLNDPVYVEAAQALARRIVTEGGTSVDDRVRHGFRLALSRPPRDVELSRLKGLYDETLSRYKADPQAAMQMATDPIGPAPAGAKVDELAAWTVMSNVLMNLDEFVARP